MSDFLGQLRFQLLALGCPVGRMQRMVQEVADHRADLVAAAEAEGLAMPAAEARAELRLGNPEALAEDLMASLRRSTWCGRHAFITFGLLPLLVFPVFWGLVLLLNLSVEFAVGFGWDDKKLHAAADDPAAFGHLAHAAQGADCAAIALAFFLFCLLARRAAAGLKGMVLAGLMCGVYSLFSYTQVSPHNFTIGLTWKPQWIRAAIPLVMVGIAVWNRHRMVSAALKTPAAAA
jgi:hypothetical protein